MPFAGAGAPTGTENLLCPPGFLSRPAGSASSSRPRWKAQSWGRAPGSSGKERAKAVQRYRAGQRVHHAYYGDGIVIESALEGRDEMVTVLFGNGIGVKTLVSNMAPMEPLPDH